MRGSPYHPTNQNQCFRSNPQPEGEEGASLPNRNPKTSGAIFAGRFLV